jgi:type VI secretion system protein ImpG
MPGGVGPSDVLQRRPAEPPPLGVDDRRLDSRWAGRCGAYLPRETEPGGPAPLASPLWRLISSLSLNHLSLIEDGREAMRELLRLHNAGDSAAGERQIQGLSSISSTPSYARVTAEEGLSFARGRRVDVEFDEEFFPGGGIFLFASVLERFLAMRR